MSANYTVKLFVVSIKIFVYKTRNSRPVNIDENFLSRTIHNHESIISRLA